MVFFSPFLPRWSRDQDGAAGDLADLDHLEDDGGGLAGLLLTDQALGVVARLEGVGVDAEAFDVGVGGDEAQVFQLLVLKAGLYVLLLCGRTRRLATLGIEKTRRLSWLGLW